MVAQSAVRVALGLAVGLIAPASAFAETAVVIDLSRASDNNRRDAAWKALGAAPVFDSAKDPTLADALAGKLAPASEKRGRDAAIAARTLAEKSQCADAATVAQVALLDLAAAQALGSNVAGAVAKAITAQFVCALAASDDGAAFAAAALLRRVGQSSAPSGVSAADWARFPELDAEANVGVAEVVIESKVPGATVWVDFMRVGPARAVVYLQRRPHIVAVAAGGAVAAKRIEVKGWTGAELLAPTNASRWTAADTMVDRIRSGERPADAAAIGELLASTGAGYAVVLLDGGVSEAWAREGDGARLIARRRSDAQAVGLVAKAARPARAPDPDRELLRETELQRRARLATAEGRKKTKWWVYAAVIGAAVVGAGIIIVGDSGDDRQRFEITVP